MGFSLSEYYDWTKPTSALKSLVGFFTEELRMIDPKLTQFSLPTFSPA